jgi:hypothetical protein
MKNSTRMNGVSAEELKMCLEFAHARLSNDYREKEIRKVTHICVSDHYLVAYTLRERENQTQWFADSKVVTKLPIPLNKDAFIAMAVDWWDKAKPMPVNSSNFDGSTEKGFLLSYGEEDQRFSLTNEFGVSCSDNGYFGRAQEPTLKENVLIVDQLNTFVLFPITFFYGK